MVVPHYLETAAGLDRWRTLRLDRVESVAMAGIEVDLQPCACGALWSRHLNNGECPTRAALAPYGYGKVSALEGEGSW